MTLVVSLVISVALGAWALVMGVVIVQQRRSPAATLAWLMVLVFLPVLGWLAYRLIGPQRLTRKRLRRQITRKVLDEALGALHEIGDAAPARHRDQLARVAISCGEAPPLHADSLELYTEGEPAFRAMAAAIAAARHHVHLEYYIWEADELGRRVRDQLVAKARAGVQVRIIVDGTGSGGARRGFFEPLVAAGAEVAWFNRVALLRIRVRRVDFRTHRKIIICDGRVGFLGGMNLAATETAELAGAKAWRDTHVRLTGSAVRVVQRAFVEDWLYARGTELPFGDAYFPPTAPREADAPPGDVVQIVTSGPDRDVFPIHKVFFAAINLAVARLWLTTPYFVPDDAILSALVSAALRGVDVRVLVPARSDSRLVDLAARSYFPDLLAAGAKVYEYQPRFVHAKTFVLDDDLAIVASANLDNRSFRIDFEIAAVVYGGPLNAELAAAFRADLDHARELTRSTAAREPFWTRLGQSGARLLSPLL